MLTDAVQPITTGKSNLNHLSGATCASVSILENIIDVERRGTIVVAWLLKEKAVICSDLKLVEKLHSQVFSFTKSLSEICHLSAGGKGKLLLQT